MNEYEVFQAIIQFGEAIQGPQILGMALYGVYTAGLEVRMPSYSPKFLTSQDRMCLVFF